MAENHHLDFYSSQTARTGRSPQKRMDFLFAIKDKYTNNPLPQQHDKENNFPYPCIGIELKPVSDTHGLKL